VVSVEDATAKLDALASRCGIAHPCYQESESDSMSEFDTLQWTSLCSQRIALQQRENEAALHDREIASPFPGIYWTTLTSTPSHPLENTYDGLNKLAA
jgi:hypothetical protein